jgi:hypothetical protein
VSVSLITLIFSLHVAVAEIVMILVVVFCELRAQSLPLIIKFLNLIF